MVTANRPSFVKRSLQLFKAQTYAPRELVIVDDGDIDLTSILEESDVSHLIRYVKVDDVPRNSLGGMRNISIEHAQGDWCIQWDDDEWYHPERIARQLACALEGDVGASALKWTLMYVNEDGIDTPMAFRSDSGLATPGTIMFRRDVNVRYQELARNEDGIFLREVNESLGVATLGRKESHLFVRIFHGGNTWGRAHFLKRLHRRPTDWPTYLVSKYLCRDITRHSAFRLSQVERSAIIELESWLGATPLETVS